MHDGTGLVNFTGARTMTALSTSASNRNALAVIGPPSTRTCAMPRCLVSNASVHCRARRRLQPERGGRASEAGGSRASSCASSKPSGASSEQSLHENHPWRAKALVYAKGNAGLILRQAQGASERLVPFDRSPGPWQRDSHAIGFIGLIRRVPTCPSSLSTSDSGTGPPASHGVSATKSVGTCVFAASWLSSCARDTPLGVSQSTKRSCQGGVGKGGTSDRCRDRTASFGRLRGRRC